MGSCVWEGHFWGLFRGRNVRNAAPAGAVQRMQIEWQPNDWIIIALRQRQLFLGRKLCPLSLSNGLAVFDGVWIGARRQSTRVHQSRRRVDAHDPAQARRGVGHAFWTKKKRSSPARFACRGKSFFTPR